MHTPARPIGRVFGSVFLLILLLFSSLSASQGGVRAAPQATTVGVAGPSAALAATPGDNLGPRSLVPTAAGILSAGSLPGLHAHPAGFERQLGVLATITVGSFPTAALVDPRNGEVYVEDSGGTGVHLLNNTTLVERIQVGSGPIGAVFDPQDGFVYVDDSNSYNVTIINGTKDIGNLSTGAYSTSILYDPADGDVYVANYGGSNVTVIHGTTIAGSVLVGEANRAPYALGYDAAVGDVYATVTGDVSLVSIINGTSLVGTVTLPVDAFPTSLTYDPSDGYMVVVDQGSGNLTLLNGTTVVATVEVGSGLGPAVFDSISGAVYVANSGIGNSSVSRVSILEGTALAGNVTIPIRPYAAAFDAATGDLVLAGNYSGLTVINSTEVLETVPLPSPAFGVQYDPSNQYLYAMDSEIDSVSVLGYGAFFNVTFSESGVPAGWSWSASLGKTNLSTTARSMTFLELNGSYAYAILGLERSGVPFPAWTEAPVPLNGTVLVNGSSVALPTMNFSVEVVVVFQESGLPFNSSWSVTLNGLLRNGSFGEVVFYEAHGVYNYSISPVRGYYQSTLPFSGTLNLSANGTSNNSYYFFEPTLQFFPVAYLVTISESGLPAGLEFSAFVAGTPQGITTDGGTDTLTWTDLANGSYFYQILPIAGWHQSSEPYTGRLVVNGDSQPINGSGIGDVVDLQFFESTFPVRFIESGLASGTSWSVKVGTVRETSSTPTIWFSEPNGTLPFTIPGVAGYSQNVTSGAVDVAATSVLVTIDFTAVTYGITFKESGLPAGLTFGITLAGTEETLTTTGGTDSLVLSVPNGTLPYAISGVAGWRQSTLPATGTVGIHGAGVTLPTLEYTAVTYSVEFLESGLPEGTSWTVTLGGVILSATAPTVDFSVPNGSYAYEIGGLGGWHQTTLPHTGSVLVAGSSVIEVTLVFSQVLYALTFSESGLPVGANWSVWVGSTVHYSTGASIVFEVANGTATYSIFGVSSYSPARVFGSVAIVGSGSAVAVSFSAQAVPTQNPWVEPLLGGIGLGILIGIGAAVGVVVLRRRRSSENPSPSAITDDPYHRPP